MFLDIALAVVAGSLIYFVYDYIQQLLALRKYPPGPIPLPLIGNLHLLSSKPHLSFKELAKRYGNVFSLSMGRERVVVVSSIESAKEALIQRGTDIAGRPTNLYTVNFISRNGKDIAFADYGERWRAFRKIAHNSLKMYGSGMEQIESLVVKEIDHLEDVVDATGGEAINPVNLISNAVVNIICAMVFGSRYEVDDPELLEVLHFSALFVQGFGNSDAVAFLPWLRFFPLTSFGKLKQAVSIRDRFLKRKIDQHMATYDPDKIRDFTDAVIRLAQEETLEGSKSANWFTEDHVTMILMDIFLAGAETTATTLRWALVYLVHYPEKQEKAKEELRAVVGKNKFPQLSQRKHLPYIEALIHEVLRRSSLVPLGAPHKAIRDTTVNGLNIPEGTQVLFNLWALHHDQSHWKNPDAFEPERWLDENGHFEIGKNTSYLPFMAGRRVCLGEAMAKAELFLFLSFILHNYEILPAGDDDYPSLEGITGITFSPKPYKCAFRKVANH